MTLSRLLDNLLVLFSDLALALVLAAVPFVIAALLLVRGRRSPSGKLHLKLARCSVLVGLTVVLTIVYNTGRYQGLKGSLLLSATLGLLGESWFAYMSFIWSRFKPSKSAIPHLRWYRRGWWLLALTGAWIPRVAPIAWTLLMAMLVPLGFQVWRRIRSGLRSKVRATAFLKGGWIAALLSIIGMICCSALGAGESWVSLFGTVLVYSPVVSAAFAMAQLDVVLEESLRRQLKVANALIEQAGLSESLPASTHSTDEGDAPEGDEDQSVFTDDLEVEPGKAVGE